MIDSMSERFRLIPAVYLILRRGSEVLLLERANTGYQDGNYSVVAGHMDGDELGTTAMIREAKEEAGIELTADDLNFVHLVHRLNRETGDERVDVFYEAYNWAGDISNVEPHKCSDLSWFPIDDLPDNMIPLIRNVLTSVKNKEHYSEYEIEPR
jgi:8-oxo-dGTP diphosphatase